MVQVVEKIRVKGAARDFKCGRPGRTGAARLERRVYALLVAANRLARKPPSADTAYAQRLAGVLQLFVTVTYPPSVAGQEPA